MCLCRSIFHFQISIFKSSGIFAYMGCNLTSKIRHVSLIRNYCDKETNFPPVHRRAKGLESKSDVVTGWRKYEIFKDENAPLILDIEEERLKSNEYVQDSQEDEFVGISLERGISGVFDIGELVELLKRENAQDVFVASLPSNLNYVDFIIVVTGKSQRHMKAMAEFIRKAFKRKMHAGDQIPKIEGENSKDWIAMDLGNIAVHIFSKQSRNLYDLESLWSVGSQYDLLSNKPEDPLVELLERHSIYLGDLRPAETLG
ncbi:uncharacterized protein [Anabrus simplex]|uniref:uncharacterized protein n=1 Tax=Anabrus simplex TaxID=316456 RepID=UPI0035A2A3A1